jgi:hypothetical protein
MYLSEGNAHPTTHTLLVASTATVAGLKLPVPTNAVTQASSAVATPAYGHSYNRREAGLKRAQQPKQFPLLL